MSNSSPRGHLTTHEVTNQPAALGDRDLWATDPGIRAHAIVAGADPEYLASYGAKIGTQALREAGQEANRHAPELLTHDAGGRRLDEVRFHPAYHQLLSTGIGAGYAAIAWEGRAGGHASHAAMVYLTSQVEPGVCCPMTMTYAAVPALNADQRLFDQWVPKLTARVYDGAPKPLARKPGATLGMAMTEKQGGSDLSGTSTQATRDGDAYRLTGHKWFCSAPMSDGFLTLAQAPEGLTCFLVPRAAALDKLVRRGDLVEREDLRDPRAQGARAQHLIDRHAGRPLCVGRHGVDEDQADHRVVEHQWIVLQGRLGRAHGGIGGDRSARLENLRRVVHVAAEIHVDDAVELFAAVGREHRLDQGLGLVVDDGIGAVRLGRRRFLVAADRRENPGARRLRHLDRHGADRPRAAGDQHAQAIDRPVGEQRPVRGHRGHAQAGTLFEADSIGQGHREIGANCDLLGRRTARTLTLAVGGAVDVVEPDPLADTPLRHARADRLDHPGAVAMGHGGARTSLPKTLPAFLDRVRSAAPTPVAVGFGIGRPEQVAELRGHADGVVVGSRLVQAIENDEDIGSLVADLKRATRSV